MKSHFPLLNHSKKATVIAKENPKKEKTREEQAKEARLNSYLKKKIAR